MRSLRDEREPSRHADERPRRIASHEFSDELYRELQRIATVLLARERPDCPVQATMLVHDAFLTLQKQQNLQGAARSKKLAAAVKTMRRLLIDYARAQRRQKRGGNQLKEFLPPDVADVANPFDVVELNDALACLRAQCPVSANVVEMKFFGGMSHKEIGQAVGLSERTVGERWRFAKCWLRRALTPNSR